MTGIGCSVLKQITDT